MKRIELQLGISNSLKAKGYKPKDAEDYAKAIVNEIPYHAFNDRISLAQELLHLSEVLVDIARKVAKSEPC